MVSQRIIKVVINLLGVTEIEYHCVLQNNQQQTISIFVTKVANGLVLTESIQLYSPESVVGIINKQRNLVQCYTIHQILKPCKK